jgi:hypothetical protein
MNPGLLGERLASNYLNHGLAIIDAITFQGFYSNALLFARVTFIKKCREYGNSE